MIKNWQKIALISVFAVFFGLLEAIVVVYLRQLLGLQNSLINRQIAPSDIALTLGFIAFLKPQAAIVFSQSERLLSLEVWRELSTIAMLITLSLIAGKTTKEKFAYFLLVFAVWDIFYYLFLRILVGWPISLFDLDVFFLIPVPLVGPVITPVVISVILILLAVIMLNPPSRKASEGEGG